MSTDTGGNFERAILPWLRVLFPHVRRSGKGFEGADFINTPKFSIEAKARKAMKLAEWVKQSELDAKASGAKYPIVIHKRRFFGPQKAYVTMSLESWVEMLAAQQGIELPDDLYPVSDEDTDAPDWA